MTDSILKGLILTERMPHNYIKRCLTLSSCSLPGVSVTGAGVLSSIASSSIASCMLCARANDGSTLAGTDVIKSSCMERTTLSSLPTLKQTGNNVKSHH